MPSNAKSKNRVPDASEPGHPRTGTFVSLGDPSMAREMAAVKAAVTKSPEAAREFLSSIGIITKGGKLTKRFGG